MSYINSKEFSDNLERWVTNGHQPSAAKLNSKKSSYPTTVKTVNGFLYRGMAVTNDFIENCKTGLKVETFSSWTLNRRTAEKFARDAARSNSNKTKILIKKRISSAKIILNIGKVGQTNSDILIAHGFDEAKLGRMITEQEVLVGKGIIIKSIDLVILSKMAKFNKFSKVASAIFF